MSFPASPRPRVPAPSLHWPRIYALCAVTGFGLGLLVLGPLCFGPPRLPLPLDFHVSLHVGR